MSKHGTLWRKLRKELLEYLMNEQNGNCAKCGHNLRKLLTTTPNRIILHHIGFDGENTEIPDIERHKVENVLMVCRLCHNQIHCRDKLGKALVSTGDAVETEFYKFYSMYLKSKNTGKKGHTVHFGIGDYEFYFRFDRV